MKDKFEKWILENSDRITRPEKYSGAIKNISDELSKLSHVNINLYEIKDVREVVSLRKTYFSNKSFYDKNVRGHNMYSRSLDLYIEFLENNICIDNILKETQEIRDDSSLTVLEKESLILSRIGQGIFREGVIELWKSCVISKYDDCKILVASHIKPWRKSSNDEKLDKYNGLLLLPTFDKLFDLGLISFEDNGRIIISKFLTNSEQLGIYPEIKIDVKEDNIKYLEYHRNNIFKKK